MAYLQERKNKNELLHFHFYVGYLQMGIAL